MPREWLEYRLESLHFENGAVLNFRNALMLYADDRDGVIVTRLGMPPAAVAATIAKTLGASGRPSPIREIRYEMNADGYPREAFFFHPLGRGAQVFLERPRGENILLIHQQSGRTIFSKDWTLRDVTQGRIPIDKAVWQFHGYKHEG